MPKHRKPPAAAPQALLVSWRQVVLATIEQPSGYRVCQLECGHTDLWPATFDVPLAMKCGICEPPTFHGRPVRW